jgi:hypothetical protein
MRHETLLKVGLVALALVVVGTGFTIVEASRPSTIMMLGERHDHDFT